MKKLLLLTVGLAGCAASVGETRAGAPHAARPLDCKLEFVSVGAAEMMPGARFGAGGELEMVGAVSIGAKLGTDAMSEEMRRLVRPRACRMGGEVVSLLATGASHYARQLRSQQDITFTVWGKRSTSAAPQAF